MGWRSDNKKAHLGRVRNFILSLCKIVLYFCICFYLASEGSFLGHEQCPGRGGSRANLKEGQLVGGGGQVAERFPEICQCTLYATISDPLLTEGSLFIL